VELLVLFIEVFHLIGEGIILVVNFFKGLAEVLLHSVLKGCQHAHKAIRKCILCLSMALSLFCSVCVGCRCIGRVFGGAGAGSLDGGVFGSGVGVGLVASAVLCDLGKLFVVKGVFGEFGVGLGWEFRELVIVFSHVKICLDATCQFCSIVIGCC